MKVKFYIEEKCIVCVCCQLHFSERKFKYAKKNKQKKTVFERSNLTYRIRKKE